MGSIADAALRLLDEGPRLVGDLAEALSGDATRARHPVRAVRRALRNDPRVIDLGDGLVASRHRALHGVVLTRRVTGRESRAGVVEVQDDLAPIAPADSPMLLTLPPGTPPGAMVAARVSCPDEGVLEVARVPGPPAHVEGEDALLARLRQGLADAADAPRPGVGATHRVVVVTRLRDALLWVTAHHPWAFRTPGRPLSAVLADAGLEAHLGWVARAGADWSPFDHVEAALLEADVQGLLAREQVARALDRQARLVSLCDARIPGRSGAARRRMAAILERAGRPHDAMQVLLPLAGAGDPDDAYAMALAALAAGDDVAARRAVEEGLACATGSGSRAVRDCLGDLASQLDAEAALRRFAERTPGPAGWVRDPRALARSVLSLGRAHLVEAVVEEIAHVLAEDRLLGLVDVVASTGGDACDDLLAAMAAVFDGAAGARATDAVGGRVVTSPVAMALARPRVVAAWATAPDDAPDQQQVIVAAGRDGGRVAPLVALVDHHDLGGALKDAFFLPDMVPARLHREVLGPMADAGIPARAMQVGDARDVVLAATAAAVSLGWVIPSEAHQPVVARIARLWAGDEGPGGPVPPGGTPLVV